MARGTIRESKDLHGLVLIGGKSTRLGQDKAQITWQGKKAVDRVFELLTDLCESTFISGRQDQMRQYSQPYLSDTFENIGPMGGITSAFQSFPRRAWLVLAVDHLLVDSNVLNYLIERRDVDADISVFQDSDNQFQPLCAIYEPSIHPLLENAITKNQYALHEVIRKSQYNSVQWPGDPHLFLNVNTKKDLKSLLGD